MARFLASLVARRESAPSMDGPLTGVTPPRRDAAAGFLPIEPSAALSLSGVYRANAVLSTAAMQLGIKVERGGEPLPASQIATIIKEPSLTMDRPDFIEMWVLSLALNGNAYVRKHYAGDMLTELEVLPAAHVRVERDPKTRQVFYHHGRDRLTRADIIHTAMMRVPGRLTGLGPIQAARLELSGASSTRDYAANWFSQGHPQAILTSEQALTADDARRLRNRWNELDDDGQPIDQSTNPSRVRVLGKGLTYTPLFLAPKDAQWLEAQQFNTTMIARLFGIPAPLMLAAVEGNAQTYSNVEQEWTAFVRFTLMSYLLKIENALTRLLPHGQRVKFNIDSLLRSDTKTRYEAHAIGLGNGFLTVDEVRELEGRAPLTQPATQKATQ